MKTLPKIETERLLLTELEFTDIPAIVKYASDKHVSEFTSNIPHPYFEKDAIYWINLANQGLKQKSNYIFGIRLKQEAQFIGGISLTANQGNNRAEVGYWVAKPYWGKGLTTEATKAILRFGFEDLRLNKVTSSHMAKNPASGRVMQKSGMVKEGFLASHILKDSKYHDLVVYGITQRQYKSC